MRRGAGSDTAVGPLRGEPLKRGKEKDRKSRQGSRGDIVDFVDEHVVSFDELEPEEQTACVLAANLLSGLLFLGAALIAML